MNLLNFDKILDMLDLNLNKPSILRVNNYYKAITK